MNIDVLNIYPIPALDSNYFWLIQPSQVDQSAYILDPGDADPVLAELRNRQLTLAGIIITHHHWDHTNGINELLNHYPVPVYGPDSPRIPQITHKLFEGDILDLPGLQLDVIEVPGHTLDHIAYLDKGSRPAKLFCGDTLFAGGCGRMFEGQPEQMLNSLRKLATLPEDTLIYCSHEYTLQNLQFALMLEPDNETLKSRLDHVEYLRLHDQSTLPTNIGIEKRTNPFLRCHLPAIKKMAEKYATATLNSDASVFAAIRRWKDEN